LVAGLGVRTNQATSAAVRGIACWVDTSLSAQEHAGPTGRDVGASTIHTTFIGGAAILTGSAVVRVEARVDAHAVANELSSLARQAFAHRVGAKVRFHADLSTPPAVQGIFEDVRAATVAGLGTAWAGREALPTGAHLGITTADSTRPTILRVERQIEASVPTARLTVRAGCRAAAVDADLCVETGAVAGAAVLRRAANIKAATSAFGRGERTGSDANSEGADSVGANTSTRAAIHGVGGQADASPCAILPPEEARRDVRIGVAEVVQVDGVRLLSRRWGAATSGEKKRNGEDQKDVSCHDTTSRGSSWRGPESPSKFLDITQDSRHTGPPEKRLQSSNIPSLLGVGRAA